MNTRLQVEHPVTEAVTGLDLVELMIRSAAGERLPAALLGGARAPILGWAFEARVYAEDPLRGFLPSTGRLSGYAEPQTFGAAGRDPFLDPAATEPVPAPGGGAPYAPPAIRADAGVALGSEISMFYDPMICKMITHGATRASALDRLRACLDAYVIRGVGHNISFLRELCEHPRFVSGAIDTSFIAHEYPAGFGGVRLAPAQTLQLVAAAAVMNAFRLRDAGAHVDGASPAATLPDPSQVVVALGRKTAAPGTGALSHPPTFHVRLGAGEPEEHGLFEHDAAASPSASAAAAAAAFHSTPMGDGVVYHAAITPVAGDEAVLRATGPTAVVRLGNVDWAVDTPLFLAGLLDTPAGAEQSLRTLRLQHVRLLRALAAGAAAAAAAAAVSAPSPPARCAPLRPQVARLAEGFTLTAYGATQDVYVRTPLAHALNTHMLPLRTRDATRALVSPMPGALVSVAVAAGQVVEEGQECAVVEAMKMQNLLRAPRKSRVTKVCAKPGDTLTLDQVIVEFEPVEAA